MQRQTRIFKVLALLLVLLLTLTACSGNNGGSNTGSNGGGGNQNVGASNNGGSDDYPSKPVNFVVAYSLGGGVDSSARQILPGVEKALGNNIKIENRPGASGVTATNYVFGLPADGYNILVHGMPSINLSTFLFAEDAQYEIDDMIPIASWINADGNALVVNKQSPINTLEDFIELSKTKELSVAVNGGVGSSDHATFVALREATGGQLTMVPYESDSDQAILGGHVDAGFVSLSGGSVTTDNFKFLAVTTPERVEGFPDLPTFKELGYDELTLSFFVGAFAKKGTPESILKKLEAAFKEAFEGETYQSWGTNAKKPIGEFKGLDEFGELTSNVSKTIQEILPAIQKDMEESGLK